MTPPRFRRLSLAHASAVLAGVLPLAAAAGEVGWSSDMAVLSYQEDGGRVQALEPVISLKNDLGDERVFSARLVLDSLTGASPNGAAPARVAQVFTGPSGGSAVTTTPAGQLPLDDAFEDERVAVSLSWTAPIGERARSTVGANASSESDFLALGASGALALDLNNKNTTLSLGAGIEVDRITPEGGAPLGLSTVVFGPATGENEAEVEGEGAAAAAAPEESRRQVDVMLGLTQVLGRHSLLQLNYGVTRSSGYHTDPYKILTVLDGSYRIAGGSLPGSHLYAREQRPETRTRQSVFAEWKFIFTENVIDLSARLTRDDWGVDSQTLDLKYRLALGQRLYLEPHLRWYTQTAADFYHGWLQDGAEVTIAGDTVLPLRDAASADARLGAFDAGTTGLKVGWVLGPDSEINLRAERYRQVAAALATPDTGDLAGVQVVPDFSATWYTLGYSFHW